MTDADTHCERPVCPNKCIALIGLSGAGKSVVGREIAALVGGEHIDVDDLIVRQAGSSIAAIFASSGEAGFRELEVKAIAEALRRKPAVISTGGGAVLDERNVRAIKSESVVVWLTAPVEELCRRLRHDELTTDHRPLLAGDAGPDEIRKLLAQREPLYCKASDLVIDTTNRSPEQIARAILQ